MLHESQVNSKYKLPTLNSARSEMGMHSSIFHQQRRKYLLSQVRQHKINNNPKQYSNCFDDLTNISKLLKSVRNQYHNEFDQAIKKKTLKLDNISKIVKKQNQKQRRQKKILCNSILEIQKIKMRESEDKDTEIYNFYNEMLERKITVRSILLQNKPPQRYKTQMCIYQSSIVLFGGIGCEKNITWAKLNFNPQSIELPSQEIEQQLISNSPPFYGHTMKSYKNVAYIFGGVNGDTLNDILILNLKTMKIKNGCPAPFRRKNHAATMVSKFLVIYGGIQRSQTKNSLFYYDTQSNNWIILPTIGLPFLSDHSMITLPGKNKRKINHISQNNDIIYVFGGKNDKGECSNKLYKMKIIHEFQIFFEEVILNQLSDNPPDKRFSCCFQYIDNGNILLYGGKENEERSDENVKNGTFNDTYLFNVYRKTWKRQQTNLEHRQSVASTNTGGKVYIFGGFEDRHYADANLIVMKFSQNSKNLSHKYEDDLETKQVISYIPSSRRLENGVSATKIQYL